MAHLNPYLHSILKLSIWLAVLVAVFVPLERFFAVYSHKTLRKGVGVDLCYYFLNNLLVTAILSLPVAALAWMLRHFVPSGWFALTASLPWLARIIAGFVMGEIGYYWGHRWSHQIPFLWKFHSIHHSAEEMDFLVNTRSHPLDMVFGRFCGIVPIYVLGLTGPTPATGGTAVALIVTLIGTVWGFFVHANLRLRLGPLEWLVSTPKFHHWHHTKYGAIDHNYASTLPWIDRIFGTHNLPKEWPESYGIDAQLPSTLLGQLTYPLLPDESTAPVLSEGDAAPVMPSNGAVPVMPSNGTTMEQGMDSMRMLD